MSPRWRVEEGRFVEDESVFDLILTVPEGKLDAVLDAIAELAQRLLGDDDPQHDDRLHGSGSSSWWR